MVSAPTDGHLRYDLHATVELGVGCLLLVVPWFSFSGVEQVFFVAAGVVVLLVWALSGRHVLTPTSA